MGPCRIVASVVLPVAGALLLGVVSCNCDDDEDSSSTPTTFKIEEERNWFDGSSTYEWNSPGGSVRYTLDLDVNHGDVRVTIFDALGRVILDQFYNTLDWYWYIDAEFVDIEFTDIGQAGIWTIILNYDEYTGSVDLLLESLVEPEEPVPPPSQSSPLLDVTYGTNGRATFTTGSVWGRSLALDSSGRAVVAGTEVDATGRNLIVSRFLPTGFIDAAFGGAGLFSLEGTAEFSAAFDVAVDTSDRPVVAGWTATEERRTDLAVLRLTTSGALDPSFGTGGLVTLDDAGGDEVGTAVALDATGRVLVAGITGSLDTDARTMVLARYTAAGVLDGTFGTGGIVRSTGFRDRATELLVDALQQPIVLGVRDQSLILWKFLTSGAPDATFGTGGIVTQGGAANEFRVGTSLAFKPDNTIVVTGGRFFDTGTAPVDLAIWRFAADGSPLNTFDGDGFLTYTFAGGAAFGTGVIFDGSGRILVVGRTRTTGAVDTDGSATLWRYLDTGAIDTTLIGSDGTGVARFDVREPGIATGASSLIAVPADGVLASGGVVEKSSGSIDLLIWKLQP